MILCNFSTAEVSIIKIIIKSKAMFNVTDIFPLPSGITNVSTYTGEVERPTR